MSPEEQPSRKHLRFKPDPLEYAQVSLDAESAEFSPAFVALIVEESPVSGCSLIAHEHADLNPGDRCRVKIGQLAPILAELAWKRPMESGLMRVGFQFLE
jgi:hypothetical protein